VPPRNGQTPDDTPALDDDEEAAIKAALAADHDDEPPADHAPPRMPEAPPRMPEAPPRRAPAGKKAPKAPRKPLFGGLFHRLPGRGRVGTGLRGLLRTVFSLAVLLATAWTFSAMVQGAFQGSGAGLVEGLAGQVRARLEASPIVPQPPPETSP
jgi:hypothetical protein